MSVVCPNCSRVFRRSLGTHVQKCGVDFEDIFWSRVDKNGPNGCWLWTGTIRKTDGYGHFMHKYPGATKLVTRKTHRLAWELLYGSIDPRLDLIHSCDNPPCCNPAHLRLGTEKDNMQDCKAKGRNVFGERNRHAKLTEAQVQSIRAEYWYKNGRSNIRELAAKYGMSRITLTAIVSGRIWKHLPHTPIRPRSKHCDDIAHK
jgi:hypothetical protein